MMPFLNHARRTASEDRREADAKAKDVKKPKPPECPICTDTTLYRVANLIRTNFCVSCRCVSPIPDDTK
jgi:hypothetical protein